MNWITIVFMLGGLAFGLTTALKKKKLPDGLAWAVLALLCVLVGASFSSHTAASCLMALACGTLLGNFAGSGFKLAPKPIGKAQTRPVVRFCPNCKTALVERNIDGKHRMACPSCPWVFWNNPIPVASVLIPSDERTSLLLVKRAIPPRAGFFALPGGFLEPGEDPAVAAVREVKEETGLDVEIDRLLRVVTIEPANEILFFYLAKPNYQIPKTSVETSEVTYFAFQALPKEIAFRIHQEVIDSWIAEEKARQT